VNRFVFAWTAAAAVILSAPFVGQIRSAIRAQFPGHFVLVVGSIIGLVIGAALLLTLLRIRDRRALRYGALVAAAGIGVGYSMGFAQGRADVDVVERFHFVEFGIVTLLFYRAWRPRNDWSIFVLPYLAGLLVGTLEEWFQWFIPVRVGEMRDIFLNSVAIATGLLFSVAVDPPPTLAAVGAILGATGSFTRLSAR
jgi:VanZ family protein